MQDDLLNKETIKQPVVFVTGLSGAGKSTILRALEDLGYELVDNAPVQVISDIVGKVDGPIVIGLDSRTNGFEASTVIELLTRLRLNPSLHIQLIYATSETDVLLRRYTATRRRHPMAAGGTVKEGIEAEIILMEPLRQVADLVIDTSDLPPFELRLLVETRYSLGKDKNQGLLTLTLMSFAFPSGVPREADMVFDARFLHNPYYIPELSKKTGLDKDVQEYVEKDPDYQKYVNQIDEMLNLIFPRFVLEGKKYATIAVGCSGGRHRSVTIVEDLAERLAYPKKNQEGLPVLVMHRELARQGIQTWRWVARPQEQAI
ncbi:RNase adaptor protein RapZ for GlmZ sRNA degradation [Commensalibacter communis]|uniref:RNase adapter RapZ n=1 Tax=Commensalibacter communis TaxID=2972786 RepID=UPI0022FF7C4F|nr:RNase adapter RapZ [Commensalibacter communis]CAI3939153.1 RNase adaptor protein RapZ for GlmZ sRNA degradation [Commensalibacter communis]CAI3940429.1 RNase adaptor protein RapZ for GlmZ sRNA degradation [Commensalibacter communis]